MLADLRNAWALVPDDIKSYVLSVAANISSGYFSRKGSDQQKRFEQAFEAALQAFIITLEINDFEYLRTKLDDAKIRGLLLGVLANPGRSSNVEELAVSMGVDNTDKKLEAAVFEFQSNFEERALEGADPLNWLIYLRMQEYFSNAKPEQTTNNLSSLKKLYLNNLREDFERLTFKGYTKGKAISIPLRDIYTEPLFSSEIIARESVFRFGYRSLHAGRNVSDRSTNEIFRSHLAVITGGPGTGKSTFFKYLALCLASQDDGENPLDILPIIFPISAYAEKRRKVQGDTYTIRQFLSQYWKEKYIEDPVPLFEHYWNRGKALFLIDGLDEVIDEGERQAMVSDIRNFIRATMRESPAFNRFYISCRTASYSGGTQFEQIKENVFIRFEIERFNISQVAQFLYGWYSWYERELHNRTDTYAQRAASKRDEMIEIIKANPNINDLASNPLMLTILCLIEHEGGRLPNSRAELYGECLRILSGAWENLRSLWEDKKVQYSLGNSNITEGMVVDFFGAVAFRMHDAAEKEVDEGDLLTLLTKSFSDRQQDPSIARDQAVEFIKIMRERSGLLDLVKPKTFSFLHQTFREYLAARWLVESVDYKQELGDRVLKPEWREVVLLMAACLAPKEASRFIWELMTAENDRYSHICLAEMCLVDMGTDRTSHSAFSKLLPDMRALFEKETDLPNKSVVACILGRMEDYRKELEEFVPIEGGLYELEDLGKFELQPFEIGRYPVTNYWYLRFLHEAEKSNKMNAYPRFIKDPVYNCPTSPVTGISLQDAVAFCNWLTEKKEGFSYFLPSCEQWQAAAAGKEKRLYPWGNDDPMNRCNTIETSLLRPSPVGMFPDSVTPEGVFDMAGNVWERTSSKEGSWGILKGGSWKNSRYDARCAMHEREYITVDEPSSHRWDSDEFGFRCCRTRQG